MPSRMVAAGLLLLGISAGVLAQAPSPVAPELRSPDEIIREANQYWLEAQDATDQTMRGEAFRRASELVDRALALEPGHVGANVLAGELFVTTNRFDQARTAFQRVLEREPSNYRANLGLGRIWLAARSPRQALNFLQAADNVASGRERAEVKRLLASAYLALRRTNDAVTAAEEAVRIDADALEGREILVEVLTAAAETVGGVDVQRVNRALDASNALIARAVEIAAAAPWDRGRLARIDAAYQKQLVILQMLHNSFYERNFRNEAMEVLRAGTGPEAAQALSRMGALYRRQALLRMVLTEHDALLLAETAVGDQYDPRNVEYLQNLASAHLQLRDLTSRLLGRDLSQDEVMRKQLGEICGKILAVEPHNRFAVALLEQMGLAAPGTAEPSDETDTEAVGEQG